MKSPRGLLHFDDQQSPCLNTTVSLSGLVAACAISTTPRYHALTHVRQMFCAFIFEHEILDTLPGPQDRRVEFIHDREVELQQALTHPGGGLLVEYGQAGNEAVGLATGLGVEAAYFNHDDEPASPGRNMAVRGA